LDGDVVLLVILPTSWSERVLEDGLEHCSAQRQPSLDSIFLYETLFYRRGSSDSPSISIKTHDKPSKLGLSSCEATSLIRLHLLSERAASLLRLTDWHSAFDAVYGRRMYTEKYRYFNTMIVP
jgi:hypothetical protein